MKKNPNMRSSFGQRSKPLKKTLIMPDLSVRNFNPWQSTYGRDFFKDTKRTKSLIPKLPSSKQNRHQPKTTFKIKQKTQSPLETRQSQKSQQKPSKLETKQNSTEFEIQNTKKQKHKENFHDRKLASVVKENAAYFGHLQGKCLCAQCNCGHCKCPPNQLRLSIKPTEFSTTHTRSFGHPGNPNRPSLKRQQSEQLRLPPNFDGPSTYQKDFIELNAQKVNKSQRFPRAEPVGLQRGNLQPPFPDGSSYNANFLNWKDSVRVARFTENKMNFSVKRPFNGKSSYKDYGNFKKEDLNRGVNKENFGKPQFDNPLGPYVEMKKESKSQSTYKPIGNVKKVKGGKKEKEKGLIVNYKGYFKTSGMEIGGQRPPVCQSRNLILGAKKEALKRTMDRYSELLNQG